MSFDFRLNLFEQFAQHNQELDFAELDLFGGLELEKVEEQISLANELIVNALANGSIADAVSALKNDSTILPIVKDAALSDWFPDIAKQVHAEELKQEKWDKSLIGRVVNVFKISNNTNNGWLQVNIGKNVTASQTKGGAKENLKFGEFELLAKYGDEGLNMIQTLELIKAGKPVLSLQQYNDLFLAGKLDDVLKFGPFWVNQFYVIPAVGKKLLRQVEFGNDSGKIYVPVPNEFRGYVNGALTLVLTPDNFKLQVSGNGKEAKVELLKDFVAFKMPTGNDWYLFNGGQPSKASSSSDKGAFYLWRRADAFAGLGARGVSRYGDVDVGGDPTFLRVVLGCWGS